MTRTRIESKEGALVPDPPFATALANALVRAGRSTGELSVDHRHRTTLTYEGGRSDSTATVDGRAVVSWATSVASSRGLSDGWRVVVGPTRWNCLAGRIALRVVAGGPGGSLGLGRTRVEVAVEGRGLALGKGDARLLTTLWIAPTMIGIGLGVASDGSKVLTEYGTIVVGSSTALVGSALLASYVLRRAIRWWGP